MEYMHVRSLEKYHPGYKDRELKWAKMYFSMVQGDPEFEMIEDEIDKWRYCALIILELQAKEPIPINDRYLTLKGFNLKKRSISLTIKMLHNFVDVVTKDLKPCNTEEYTKEVYTKEKDTKEKDAKEKERIPEKTVYAENVKMHSAEYDKLLEKLGDKGRLMWCIEKLNNHKGSSGKTYKSDYHAILKWVIEALEKYEKEGKKGRGYGRQEVSDEFLKEQAKIKLS